MRCVVYTFESESVECVLYEDAIDGAIQSASAFTLGFCPKPDTKFSITYQNKKIPINIPIDIKSKFWCYEDPLTAEEQLCNFPFFMDQFWGKQMPFLSHWLDLMVTTIVSMKTKSIS